MLGLSDEIDEIKDPRSGVDELLSIIFCCLFVCLVSLICVFPLALFLLVEMWVLWTRNKGPQNVIMIDLGNL